MPISFDCDVCGKQLKAVDEHAGRRTRCPGCATVVRIPTLAPPPEEDAPYELQSPVEARADSTPPPYPTTSDDPLMSWTPPRSSSPTIFLKHRRGQYVPLESASSPGGFREYLYCLLVFALVPLLISLTH